MKTEQMLLGQCTVQCIIESLYYHSSESLFMIQIKNKIYITIGCMVFGFIFFHLLRPISKNEKMIVDRFNLISQQDITSIDITNFTGRYVVRLINKKEINSFLEILRTKEKVIGSGPRMKDEYFITIYTSVGVFTFYFRKIVKDITPECVYGDTFPQYVNCDICTDLFISNSSIDNPDYLEVVDFDYFNSKFPIYRCEGLAKFIEENVDIYEKQNPKKGQVFVLE